MAFVNNQGLLGNFAERVLLCELHQRLASMGMSLVNCRQRAKYLSTYYLELSSACEATMVKKKQQLDKIKAEIVAGSNNAFIKPDALKKKKQQTAKLRFSIHQIKNRMQRLKSAAEKNKKLDESGLATMCFGGKKLASAVNRLNEKSSPSKSKESWSKAWREARDQAWLFEGDKSAKGANENVKWDPQSKTLKIRLTDDQAMERMKAFANQENITLEELLNPNKHHSLRLECRVVRWG